MQICTAFCDCLTVIFCCPCRCCCDCPKVRQHNLHTLVACFVCIAAAGCQPNSLYMFNSKLEICLLHWCACELGPNPVYLNAWQYSLPSRLQPMQPHKTDGSMSTQVPIQTSPLSVCAAVAACRPRMRWSDMAELQLCSGLVTRAHAPFKKGSQHCSLSLMICCQ